MISNLVFHDATGEYFASAARALTYTTNLYIGFGGGPGALDQTWSLGVEEQFYLFWPIVLIVALRRSRVRRIAVGVFVGAMVTHALTVALFTHSAAYMLPTSRLDQLLAGGLLALALRADRGWAVCDRWLTSAAAWTGVVLVAALAVLPDHHGCTSSLGCGS